MKVLQETLPNLDTCPGHCDEWKDQSKEWLGFISLLFSQCWEMEIWGAFTCCLWLQMTGGGFRSWERGEWVMDIWCLLNDRSLWDGALVFGDWWCTHNPTSDVIRTKYRQRGRQIRAREWVKLGGYTKRVRDIKEIRLLALHAASSRWIPALHGPLSTKPGLFSEYHRMWPQVPFRWLVVFWWV